MRQAYVQGHKGLIGSNLVKAGAKEFVGNPSTIINCVGFTDVDACETEHWKSYTANVEQVAWLVRHSAHIKDFYGIHLSTDFIFDGGAGPYRENDKPAPLSVYGAQKWVAEKVFSIIEKHLIVRTTCVYGWHPKKRTFVHWVKEQCEKGGVFYVTEEQWTTPTYAPDLARIMLSLIEQDATGIVNVTSGDRMTRYQFARLIADAFGYDRDMVQPVGLIEQKARRPLRGGLKTNKLQSVYHITPQPIDESLQEMVKTWGIS